MFKTDKINIFRIGENRVEEFIYENIDAQIYSKNIPKTNSGTSESGIVKTTMILISSDKKDVREGDFVQYVDAFNRVKILKVVSDPEMVNFLYSKKIIQLKCDLK